MRPFLPAAGAIAALIVGCGGGDHPNSAAAPSAKAGSPSPDQVTLDGTTVQKWVNQLPILPVFAPTVISDSSGKVIRNEYTITDSQVQVQMLPPGFPTTTVHRHGRPGRGRRDLPRGSRRRRSSRTRAASRRSCTGSTNIGQPSFMPVDPTLHWANPQAIERPLPPFNLFPPGYTNAQYPVAHVTHTHGLMVLPQMDGTAEEWFTNVQYRGPSFVTEGLHDAQRSTRHAALLPRPRHGRDAPRACTPARWGPPT